MNTSSSQTSITRSELVNFVLPEQYALCFDTHKVHPKFWQTTIRNLVADSLDFEPRAFDPLARQLLGEGFAIGQGAQRLTDLIDKPSDQRFKLNPKPFNPYKTVVGGTQAFLRPNLAKDVNANSMATNARQAQ